MPIYHTTTQFIHPRTGNSPLAKQVFGCTWGHCPIGFHHCSLAQICLDWFIFCCTALIMIMDDPGKEKTTKTTQNPPKKSACLFNILRIHISATLILGCFSHKLPPLFRNGIILGREHRHVFIFFPFWLMIHTWHGLTRILLRYVWMYCLQSDDPSNYIYVLY